MGWEKTEAMSAHPTHTFDANDRCVRCNYPSYVLAALKPCPKAEVVEEKPEFDWLDSIRNAG